MIVFLTISGTFDSVKRATEVNEEISRIRPARFIHPDGIVRNYNLKESTGNRILKAVDKGKYADSDVYVTHSDIEADKQSAIIITSKRILFVVYNQMLGNWTIDFEFAYNDITGPPPTGKERNENGKDVWYIIIKPKAEERPKMFGLFGSSERGKKVYMPSREVAQNMARVIEEHRIGSQQ